jgi:hypothetical protein
MACKGSRDHWGLFLDRNLVDVIGRMSRTLVSEVGSILPFGPGRSAVCADR